jgi:tetratricopeptide (TPR) repeat protein
MESLTQEQLAYIERHGKSKNPKTIAKDLKLELRHVQHALRSLKTPKAPGVPAAAVLVDASPRASDDRRAGLVLALLIVVLGWLAYSNNLGATWHFDDYPAVISNSAIHEPSLSGIYQSNRYRQVLYWIFAGSWALHGQHERGWHIENNLIHVLNGLLVYGLVLFTLRAPAVRRPSRWPHVVAGLTGALFVLHPLQTQAVTYITQRTESLCGTFYFGAMILYALARLRRASGRARGTTEHASLPLAALVATALLSALLALSGKLAPVLALAGIGAAAALGTVVVFVVQGKADAVEAACLTGSLVLTFVACETKEIAGTIPGAMILWELVFMRARAGSTLLERGRAHVAAAPYAAMLACLPILAVAAGLDARLLLREGVQSIYDIRHVSGSEYFLTELNVLATYVRLYLLPYGQSLDYDYVKRSSLFDGPTLLSLLALLAVVAVAVRTRRSQPAFTFSVFFMLGVLAPTSLFVLPDFIFEHRLYLPLAGAAFVTVLLAERVVCSLIRDDATARRALLGGAVPVLAVLLVLTHVRNEAWANDETLWSDAHANAPHKARPLTNLGLYYQNVEPQQAWLANGDHVGGQFIDGAPLNYPDCWVVRTIFPNMKKGPRDVLVKKADVVRGPVEWGGLEKAEKMYLEALECDPDYYRARNNYALCEVQQGVLAVENANSARGALAHAAPDNPAIPRMQQTAERLEADALKHFSVGERELREILVRHPDDAVSLNNLANLYFGYLNRIDDAIATMEKSLEIDEHQAISYAVEGEMFYSRGLEESDARKLDLAVRDYRRAVDCYRRYLERAGLGDPNSPHVLQRKGNAERAIVSGGERAEAPPSGPGGTNPFNNQPGMNGIQGPRWKPPQQPEGRRP